jgi:hypothetical protein
MPHASIHARPSFVVGESYFHEVAPIKSRPNRDAFFPDVAADTAAP